MPPAIRGRVSVLREWRGWGMAHCKLGSHIGCAGKSIYSSIYMYTQVKAE